MFNRKIDYLRISVTDRCNLRCMYCIPEPGIEPVLHEEILTFEEIARLASIFASLGIERIRLTGGEPLVRKDIVNLVKVLININGIKDVSLTTNGILLSDYAKDLKNAGIKKVNISLDTLKKERFKNISGRDDFYKVINGIEKAREVGFSPLKLNMVVMKGINNDEITDFVDFSLSKGLILRFIEFMKITPLWRQDYFISMEEVKSICRKNFGLSKTLYSGPGPAEYYKIPGGTLGFIKTDEYNCRKCNRMRLTSTGELKLCLYETDGFPLRALLRRGAADGEIRNAIALTLDMKEFVNYKNWEPGMIYMSSVGG